MFDAIWVWRINEKIQTGESQLISPFTTIYFVIKSMGRKPGDIHTVIGVILEH